MYFLLCFVLITTINAQVPLEWFSHALKFDEHKYTEKELESVPVHNQPEEDVKIIGQRVDIWRGIEEETKRFEAEQKQKQVKVSQNEDEFEKIEKMREEFVRKMKL